MCGQTFGVVQFSCHLAAAHYQNWLNLRICQVEGLFPFFRDRMPARGLLDAQQCCGWQVWLSIGCAIQTPSFPAECNASQYFFVFQASQPASAKASQPNTAQVEKDGGCQRALADHFPETCMLGDVLQMGKMQKKHWKMASHFQCITHDNLYPGRLLESILCCWEIMA